MLTGPLNWAKMSIQIKFPGCVDNDIVQFCITKGQVSNETACHMYREIASCIGKCYINEYKTL